MLFLTLIFVKLLTVHSLLYTKIGSNKKFEFTKFMAPCSSKKTLTHYENLTFRQGPDTFLFDYDFVVDEDTDIKFLRFQFQKCNTAENPDSCSTLPLFRVNSNFCIMMNSENDVWTDILACTTPKMTCPYRKNIYRGRNCTVVMDKFHLFPMSNFYWKLKADMENKKNKVIFCILAEGKLAKL